jgi:hypothetical protein
LAAVGLCSHCWRASFATSPTSTTGPGAAPQAGRFIQSEQKRFGIEEGLPSEPIAGAMKAKYLNSHR